MKMIGLYNRSMMLDALHGVAARPFTRGLGWTMEEVEVYLVGVRRDLMDASQHGTQEIVVNHGALPEPGTAGYAGYVEDKNHDLFMQVTVNAREREPDVWRQLFAQADERFRFVDFWRPERLRMWFVEAEWTGE
ncbi:hypothetical protein BBK36DRAFT_1156848 [Trichoderma citrinoviride]|uniref:Uncharacterized protein n=1 Tax=Trichoderma citrinoviride TaxID=58853 RepID=A0A2T4BH04_9HYPO|nr:hypothetical protein BBK36DRAFT_1156848 [Trichoderma citrinoviride]PTB68592.1 hypothetical protein BBK36DRAFT_1156848 [Trichoderma citrinoviride]